MKCCLMARTCIFLGCAAIAPGQIVLKGRLVCPEFRGSDTTVPMTAVHCFASQAGPEHQAIGFRTWETHPAGWYYLSGSEGRYSVVFSDPAGFVRPVVLTNQFVTSGTTVDRVVRPAFDYYDLHQGTWDTKPATDYYQTFLARGTSITQVGFKLATDGVDGAGPKGQNLVVSIHRKGQGKPETWPQVGPSAIVLDVDCGGPKNYWWSAGWHSRQVTTEPGQMYAVRLRSESPGSSFQAFWRAMDRGMQNCFRVGKDDSNGWQQHNLCMTVGSDSDGLLIPYNKCVHKKFGNFAGFDRSWSQTYITQGRGLASVILYAATSGVQPSLMRQRVRVTVREDGPRGNIVGIEKVAIGNGNYTGDASWGVFGVSFAPGEVPLEPGKRYAIEFESIESYHTLHGYVNIKGQVSDDRPGFNPYRKHTRDAYEQGTAYRRCVERQPFDLDMQIIEYQHDGTGWDKATMGPNRITNGSMEPVKDATEAGSAMAVAGWKTFSIDPGTTHQCSVDDMEKCNTIARVCGGSATGKTVDGGYVQRVGDLGHLETYRLEGSVRSTWPVDEKHYCAVGYDLTGQDSDPKATTIQWTLLPSIHGGFVPYASRPLRPDKDAISIWLRGYTTLTDGYRFEADFDDFSLLQVAMSVPTGGPDGPRDRH